MECFPYLLPIQASARRALYDGLQLRTRWELQETPASRTLAKVPVPRIFFHRGALVRNRGPLTRRLPGPPAPVRFAGPEEAARLLDAARAAVAVRYREIHGFNFADPNDVLAADVGRGVHVAWFGLLQEHRLPLRAHHGYLLLKNGVPIGHGNEEAIASGAFWFYYKLGFRPKRPVLGCWLSPLASPSRSTFLIPHSTSEIPHQALAGHRNDRGGPPDRIQLG